MSKPYYIPKYNYTYNNFNAFNSNINKTHQNTPNNENKNKEEVIDLIELFDSDEEKEKEKGDKNINDNGNNLNTYLLPNNPINNRTNNETNAFSKIMNNEATRPNKEPYIIGNVELLEDDDSDSSLLDDKPSLKINISNTNNFVFPQNQNNIIYNPNNHIFPFNQNQNNLIYNNLNNYSNGNIYSINDNNYLNMDNINNYNNKNDNDNIINTNKKEEEITMTFEESINRLKNNFNKIFKDNGDGELENGNIFEDENFRQNMERNENMNNIFKYHDIIKELYEKKIEKKTVEKNCRINKIIDHFITKMKKLGKKRNIVIKDYKNYIFVIGVEMMIDLQRKEAKEFILKKMTETYKGNYKINTKDDKCYIIENNNKEKSKLIYNNETNVYMSLSMLLQRMYRDAVIKK